MASPGFGYIPRLRDIGSLIFHRTCIEVDADWGIAYGAGLGEGTCLFEVSEVSSLVFYLIVGEVVDRLYVLAGNAG